MLAHNRQANRQPLDEFIPDPTGQEPVGDAETFTALVDCMVADQAPRLFAVVQEYGERVDCGIVAWGMAFDDHADVVGIGGVQLSTRSPESALARFVRGTHITPHLVWVNPDATMPSE
jgi:hypothetical protein